MDGVTNQKPSNTVIFDCYRSMFLFIFSLFIKPLDFSLIVANAISLFNYAEDSQILINLKNAIREKVFLFLIKNI